MRTEQEMMNLIISTAKSDETYGAYICDLSLRIDMLLLEIIGDNPVNFVRQRITGFFILRREWTFLS